MVMKTFFIFNRGGEILFHWSAQEENDKQLSVNAVIKDRLLRKKSEDKLMNLAVNNSLMVVMYVISNWPIIDHVKLNMNIANCP